jgi:hypothetical protein
MAGSSAHGMNINFNSFASLGRLSMQLDSYKLDVVGQLSDIYFVIFQFI